MDAYNLADLEARLLEQGWLVAAQDYVTASEVPGRVDTGGYQVTLTEPSGQAHSGDGPTRPDALRAAADAAGLREGNDPLLR